MSSLLLRTLPRQTVSLTARRAFATSPSAQKSAVDSAKEALKSADRTVSDAAVSGIEKGGTLSTDVPPAFDYTLDGIELVLHPAQAATSLLYWFPLHIEFVEACADPMIFPCFFHNRASRPKDEIYRFFHRWRGQGQDE